MDLVEDPELPITLTDLGVVRDVEVEGNRVRVLLRPTRLGCPARDEMARRVRVAVLSVAAGAQVDVDWELRAWQPESVTPTGTQALLQIGVSRPKDAQPCCPYCDSSDVRLDAEFGGSVCKIAYSCRACGSTFDALKGRSDGGGASGRDPCPAPRR